jgi:hypothetical protein
MITLSSNTQFFKDMTDESRTVNVNGNVMPMGYWNLILSIRDCSLYAKGIKPNRHWKISNVKTYFGLKGDASKLVKQLEEIKMALTNS